MIQDARRELNQPVNAGSISDHEFTAYGNHAQRLIASKIMEADQNFFEQSDQTLGFVKSQEEYLLPAFLWDRKITRVTRTDLSEPKQLHYIRFQEKEHYHSATLFSSGTALSGEVYYLRNNYLGLKPTPQSTIAKNILIHYLRLPHEMHLAQMKTVTSTTMTMPLATTGAAPLMQAGRLANTPNYYVGARLRVLANLIVNGRGFETEITAFNVSSRLATVDTAFPSDIANGDHVQYVVLSAIPEEYHEIIYQTMLMKGAKKLNKKDVFAMAGENLRGLWENLVNTIEPRHFDENQHVRPPVDQHFD